MVHDKAGLSNIPKFHYLDEALTGEAAHVIRSLGVSDANYTLAWQTILDRFEDSRALVHFHMKALFDLPVLTKVTSVVLRQLIDDVNSHLLSLNSLNENTEAWDTVTIHLLSTKLDSYTKREWEKRLLSKHEKQTFKEMIKFLEDHCKYLHRIAADKSEINNTHNKQKLGSKNSNTKFSERLTSHATTKRLCSLCQESHSLYNCEKFRTLTVENRIDEVRKLRFCFNCLTPGHQNRQCYAGPCSKCRKKHNVLLRLENDKSHAKNESEQVEQPASTVEHANDKSSKAALVTNTNFPCTDENVMLGTAIIWVEDSSGKRHECRALLDSCSQVHLMTRELCQRLKLSVSNSNTVVSGVFKSTEEPQHCTSVKFSSCSTKYSKRITCLETPEITDEMPNLPIRRSDFEIPNGLVLADPKFSVTRSVDLLIGASVFWNLICVGQIHLRNDQPILQKTQLGWIVAGPMQVPARNRRAECNLVTNQQLHNTVQRFWEIEDHTVKRNSPHLDPRDELEQHFISTTERDENGRFVVMIPFKDEVTELGDSLHMAQKRLLATEQKLSKDLQLREKYVDFMEDYESQNHMEIIPAEDIKINKAVNYLPHHAVTKEGSTTTKVRVVFDGSAPTCSGLSFNAVQRVGPVVQNDLFSIKLRFRQHPIVLSADIAQMYRQIKINKSQHDLQRILWRKDPSQPIQHYRLKTITYGTASAPYLATRALGQIGEENKDNYPVASEVIIRDFYIDDPGHDSLDFREGYSG